MAKTVYADDPMSAFDDAVSVALLTASERRKYGVVPFSMWVELHKELAAKERTSDPYARLVETDRGECVGLLVLGVPLVAGD